MSVLYGLLCNLVLIVGIACREHFGCRPALSVARELGILDRAARAHQPRHPHQPGATFEYSLSTDVLGRVVEVVSGRPLSQFLQERIFSPLGMTDSAFIVPPERRNRLAQPFSTDRATDKPISLLDVTVAQKNDAGGAGSVGTALDYGRFLQMLLNGGELYAVRLLSPTTVPV